MLTPKNKFSVGSLLGVFGFGTSGNNTHYQDTVFVDTLQFDFEDTSPGVLHTRSNDALHQQQNMGKPGSEEDLT